LYREQIVWNKTKKRDTWGRKRRSDRATSEHLTIDMPELRIVDADLMIGE
jgi:hypothetical protein